MTLEEKIQRLLRHGIEFKVVEHTYQHEGWYHDGYWAFIVPRDEELNVLSGIGPTVEEAVDDIELEEWEVEEEIE